MGNASSMDTASVLPPSPSLAIFPAAPIPISSLSRTPPPHPHLPWLRRLHPWVRPPFCRGTGDPWRAPLLSVHLHAFLLHLPIHGATTASCSLLHRCHRSCSLLHKCWRAPTSCRPQCPTTMVTTTKAAAAAAAAPRLLQELPSTFTALYSLQPWRPPSVRWNARNRNCTNNLYTTSRGCFIRHR